MADEAPPTPGKRVAVLDPSGAFGTVDESELADLPEGARVLTKQQLAEKAVNERYEALPTGRKVLGAASAAAGLLNPLLAGSSPDAPPSIAAYGEGVREGLTGGLSQAGTRKLADAVGGKAAGDTYATQLDEQRDASPIAHGAGAFAGFGAGMALGAGGGAPGAIGGLGGLAEGGVNALSRASGLAAKGALGRAATTGLALGARGALEGGLQSAVSQASDDIVHDTPITGEKLYGAFGHGALAGGALGTTLGLGGSLVASGARGVVGRLLASSNAAGETLEGGIGALRKGAQEARANVEGAAADAKAAVGETVANAKATVAREAQEPLGAASKLASAGTKPDVLRDLANDQAFRAAGGGMGLQSTSFAKQAAKYFPGGTKDIGAIAQKYNIVDAGAPNATPLQAALTAAKGGRPADMLPRARTALSDVGNQIGEITRASNARIPVTDISDIFGRVRAEPAGIAGNEHVVDAIDKYHQSLLGHLNISPDGTVSIQDLLKQRKGLDEIVYQETKTLDPNRRVGALRAVRGEMEGLVEKALDDAGSQLPEHLRGRYEPLKKDYHGLRILNDVLEDSAARAAKHATFGLKETATAVAAVASGHFVAAPFLAVGGKLLKERGNAAAAAFLSRAADRGTFTKVIADFDARVQRAAAGAIRDVSPSAGTRRAPPRATAGGGTPDDAVSGREAVKKRQATAADIVQWIGRTKADPSQLMNELDQASNVVAKSAGPTAAQSYSSSTLRAINFISSYIPVKERRDPLDPKSTPPLTHDEASRLVRAATYATKPETVWDDFEKGKVTPEGLAAAQAFMPDSFGEFREHLQDAIDGHMLENRRLSDSQRLRISKLLGYSAGPSLKPTALARLQANFAPSPQGSPAGPQTPPNRPVNMQVQQSGFDAVEARFTS